MSQRWSALASIGALTIVLCALGLLAAAPGGATAERTEAAAENKSPAARPYTTESVRGKVVWLGEALQRLYGVTTEADAAESVVALETPAGKLLPIIPDTRGRAFAVDERLRGEPVELLVRRYRDVPMIQVIRVYRVKPEGLFEIDYWCDVCAIPMFILKACECCQGPTRIREQPVPVGTPR